MELQQTVEIRDENLRQMQVSAIEEGQWTGYPVLEPVTAGSGLGPKILELIPKILDPAGSGLKN